MINILLLFQGCQVYGIWSSYEGLPEKQKKFVKDYSEKEDIEKDISIGYIYEITDENLKKGMSMHEKNIVYDFSPACRADSCISPSAALEIASENGYKLWVILDYYTPQIMGSEITPPLYTIKSSAYNTTLVRKYKKKFEEGLGIEYEKDNYGRFHFFNRDKFQKTKQSPYP